MDREKSGTSCPPLLIPHIACCVSPEAALLVHAVFNGYITQEYKVHLAAAKQELRVKQLQLEQATELREAATLDAYRTQQQVDQKDLQRPKNHICMKIPIFMEI